MNDGNLGTWSRRWIRVETGPWGCLSSTSSSDSLRFTDRFGLSNCHRFHSVYRHHHSLRSLHRVKCLSVRVEVRFHSVEFVLDEHCCSARRSFSMQLHRWWMDMPVEVSMPGWKVNCGSNSWSSVHFLFRRSSVEWRFWLISFPSTTDRHVRFRLLSWSELWQEKNKTIARLSLSLVECHGHLSVHHLTVDSRRNCSGKEHQWRSELSVPNKCSSPTHSRKEMVRADLSLSLAVIGRFSCLGSWNRMWSFSPVAFYRSVRSSSKCNSLWSITEKALMTVFFFQVFHLHIVLGLQSKTTMISLSEETRDVLRLDLLCLRFHVVGLSHSCRGHCVCDDRGHVLSAQCRRLSMVDDRFERGISTPSSLL